MNLQMSQRSIDLFIQHIIQHTTNRHPACDALQLVIIKVGRRWGNDQRSNLLGVLHHRNVSIFIQLLFQKLVGILHYGSRIRAVAVVIGPDVNP